MSLGTAVRTGYAKESGLGDITVLRVAALVNFLVLVFGIVFVLTVNRSLGIFSMAELDNADLMLRVINESPIILVYPALDIFLGLAYFLIALSILSLFRGSGYLVVLQTLFGVSAGVFHVFSFFSRLLTLPHFAQVYLTDPEAARISYDIANFLQYGISYFINFMIGLWIITSSVLFIRKGAYNKYLNLLFIIIATISLFTVFFKPLFAVFFILLPLRQLTLAITAPKPGGEAF